VEGISGVVLREGGDREWMSADELATTSLRAALR
jgi:hypothetical protein